MTQKKSLKTLLILLCSLIYLLGSVIRTAGSDENRADVRDFLLGYCRMTDVVVTGQCLIQPGRIRRSEMRTELCITQSKGCYYCSCQMITSSTLQQMQIMITNYQRYDFDLTNK